MSRLKGSGTTDSVDAADVDSIAPEETDVEDGINDKREPADTALGNITAVDAVENEVAAADTDIGADGTPGEDAVPAGEQASNDNVAAGEPVEVEDAGPVEDAMAGKEVVAVRAPEPVDDGLPVGERAPAEADADSPNIVAESNLEDSDGDKGVAPGHEGDLNRIASKVCRRMTFPSAIRMTLPT